MEYTETLPINQLIRERRSIFPVEYTGEKVPKHVIEQMLENANWAPTHGKTEPWRFFVFTGKGLATFAEAQAEIYKAHTPEALYNEQKYQKLQKNPLLASHVIAIAMKRQESRKIPEIEEIEAVACAVQNMALTATAYGVGGYWGSGGITYYEAAKELFGLGEEDKLLGFFYVGVPAKKDRVVRRGPIANKVSWIDE
jgi:nitroreductase